MPSTTAVHFGGTCILFLTRFSFQTCDLGVQVVNLLSIRRARHSKITNKAMDFRALLSKAAAVLSQMKVKRHAALDVFAICQLR